MIDMILSIISSPNTLLGRKAWEGDFETPFFEREVGFF
jgi:hypothetical protein